MTPAGSEIWSMSVRNGAEEANRCLRRSQHWALRGGSLTRRGESGLTKGNDKEGTYPANIRTHLAAAFGNLDGN
jgi:hypothetical protein